ncbi:MAG: fatty acid desaturase [Burkholderiaceae bacterium]|nr:fatty acid desaturase [Burkholderiaceae bacterium]
MNDLKLNRGPAGTGPAGAWGSDDWPLRGHEVIPSALLKTLRQRKDLPGITRIIVHGAAIISSGILLWEMHRTVWVVPLMILFGCLLALLFGPLHESCHGTTFRTRWLNIVVGRVTGFLINRPYLYFRYRHTSHHTYTQHPKLDPDRVELPPSVGVYIIEMFARGFWKASLGYHCRGVTGRFDAADRVFLPASELGRVTLEFRLCVVGYVALIGAAFALDPWAPLLLIAGPRFFGEILLRFLRMAEHTATDDSPDLLRNTRTTLVNPVLHYFYWEMPYHAEHHLAPSVPFHALSRLHEQVSGKISFVARRGLIGAHTDILRAIQSAHRPAPAG